MKKLNEWEKKEVKTASVRIPPISLSVDHELDHHSKECGISLTDDFNEFLVESSGLNKNEWKRKVKEFILNLSKIEERKLSEKYRKHLAEQIKEVHPREEVKKRMDEYIKKREWI